MKRRHVLGLAAAAILLVTLAGCSTLNVKTPDGMFLSTGDYVPGVKTLGVIQESTTIFAPLFLFDLNGIYQGLYEKLIDRVKASGADGVMDVQFTWKPSPLTYPALAIASGVFDFYVQGIAFKKE